MRGVLWNCGLRMQPVDPCLQIPVETASKLVIMIGEMHAKIEHENWVGVTQQSD